MMTNNWDVTKHLLLLWLCFCVLWGVYGYTRLKYKMHFKSRHGNKNKSRRINRVRGGGYIYAFSDIGIILPVVKIGRSADQNSRLRSHRTAAPFGIFVWWNVKVPDEVHGERVFHDHYAGLRYHLEWFLFSPKMLVEFILIRLIGI